MPEGTLIVLAYSKCHGMVRYEYNMKTTRNRKRCSIGGELEGVECWMCTKDANSLQKSKSANNK